MKSQTLLLAISCLFVLYSCQKETITPIPESNTLTAETTDESQYFEINTLEDLATFEAQFVQNELANSRNKGVGKVVHVPSNSKNAIQAAINSVDPYGVVYLNKGNHYEEQMIVITKPVFIVGRAGATIISSNQFTALGIIEPIFSIRQTRRVTIWGVEMQGEVGNTAIEILNSSHTVVSKNTINDFAIATIVNEGDNTLFWKNEIVGRGDYILGIGIVNGADTRIIQNKISGYDWNILCGAQGGLIQSNELFGSRNIGLNLDRFPAIIQTSEGNIVGSEMAATNWTVQNNYAHDNANSGYTLSAGANNNKLINNRGGDNGIVDLVLAPEGPNALGMITPTSFENFVDTGNNKDFTIQDCGINNEVIGGRPIPCD